jgi:hypothetical protein
MPPICTIHACSWTFQSLQWYCAGVSHVHKQNKYYYTQKDKTHAQGYFYGLVHSLLQYVYSRACAAVYIITHIRHTLDYISCLQFVTLVCKRKSLAHESKALPLLLSITQTFKEFSPYTFSSRWSLEDPTSKKWPSHWLWAP